MIDPNRDTWETRYKIENVCYLEVWETLFGNQYDRSVQYFASLSVAAVAIDWKHDISQALNQFINVGIADDEEEG